MTNSTIKICLLRFVSGNWSLADQFTSQIFLMNEDGKFFNEFTIWSNNVWPLFQVNHSLKHTLNHNSLY